MDMQIDTRRVLTAEAVRRLDGILPPYDGAEDFFASRAYRAARRRYLRAIRKMSGLDYVTCHVVEHSPLHRPVTVTVAFGR